MVTLDVPAFVRIWLAVVVTVAVLTFTAAGIWRYAVEPRQLPIRELVVRDKAGEVIGIAQTRPGPAANRVLGWNLM